MIMDDEEVPGAVPSDDDSDEGMDETATPKDEVEE